MVVGNERKSVKKVSRNEKRAAAICKQIGVKEIEHAVYVNRMIKRFGEPAIRFMDLSDANQQRHDPKTYQAKNKDLES